MRDDAPDRSAGSLDPAANDTVEITRDSFGNRRRVAVNQPSESRVPTTRPGETLGKGANSGQPGVSVPIMPPAARSAKRPRLWFLLTSGSVAILAVAGWYWTTLSPQTAAVVLEQTRRDLAWSALEIRADGRGSVLEVSGPDSEMVLLGYCEPWPSRSVCEAIEVTETHPPQAGVRLGILRSPRQTELQAIRIERSQDGGRWVAGGGGKPLLPVDAPEIPEGTPAVPVSRWD